MDRDWGGLIFNVIFDGVLYSFAIWGATHIVKYVWLGVW